MFHIKKEVNEMSLEEAKEALIYLFKKYLVGYDIEIKKLENNLKNETSIPMRGISSRFLQYGNEMRERGIKEKEWSKEDKELYQDLIDWYAS